MRIGVTQRVLERPERGETWDCLDQRLFMLIQAIGYVPMPLSNVIENVPEYVRAMKLDGVVLSGGNDLATMSGAIDTSAKRDEFETALLEYCCRCSLPVFGICRGLQMLNSHFGGGLESDRAHIARPHTVAPVKGTPIDWPESFTVNSFHRWTIPLSALAAPLAALATADDGTVEAAMHVSLPILGVMWHPERVNPVAQHDLSIIRRCFEEVQ